MDLLCYYNCGVKHGVAAPSVVNLGSLLELISTSAVKRAISFSEKWSEERLCAKSKMELISSLQPEKTWTENAPSVL